VATTESSSTSRLETDRRVAFVLWLTSCGQTNHAQECLRSSPPKRSNQTTTTVLQVNGELVFLWRRSFPLGCGSMIEGQTIVPVSFSAGCIGLVLDGLDADLVFSRPKLKQPHHRAAESPQRRRSGRRERSRTRQSTPSPLIKSPTIAS
jgi:hypothetical protein